MSIHSNHLQLPKIDTRPGHYPYELDEKKFAERAVSAASSLKSSTIGFRTNPKNTDDDLFRHLNDLKDRDELVYLKCVNKMRSNMNYKTRSALRKGLLVPRDKDPDVIINKLKTKSEQKKSELRKAQKEAMQRKKMKNSIFTE